LNSRIHIKLIFVNILLMRVCTQHTAEEFWSNNRYVLHRQMVIKLNAPSSNFSIFIC